MARQDVELRWEIVKDSHSSFIVCASPTECDESSHWEFRNLQGKKKESLNKLKVATALSLRWDTVHN